MDELPVSDVDAAVGGGAGGEIRILKEYQIPRLQFPEAHRHAVAQLIRGPVGQIHPAPLKMKRGQKKLFALYAVMVLSICIGATCVYAAGDPLTVVNNLSTFIFSLIRAIGLILLGFGIVQVGLSLKSHDPSQRANGFLTLAGGIIITFAKEILDLIMG